ncbi:DUF2971 domain-containing protein [Labilibacter marinus]|uniref:DUF2971 domain-containing protein n=1 Tax=Labilibacter marinus TaxID=1477105 RepID=UPI000834BE47|nr:DUF2971 domain-containing protein [Labilibacter marinus]
MIVYKYRDWNNVSHRNLLIYNEIYLASPKDFNDPFDCRIYPNFLNLTDTEREDYLSRLEVIAKKSNESKKALIGLKDLKEALVNDPQLHQDRYVKKFIEEQDKYYGILSLSLRWNSILLWSHYANCHRGFCVGFHENKLRESGLFGTGGIVKYDDQYPEIKPSKDQHSKMENSFKETHSKSIDWKYEEEYRLTKLFFPKSPLPFERVINFSDDFIAEVVLGINISEKHKTEIMEICVRKRIPVYSTQPVPFRFEIERNRINNNA